MNQCEVLIRESMARVEIRTFTELAKRLGMVRQTLSYRLSHPQTFLGSEISAMMDLFSWNDKQISDFMRGMKDGGENRNR